MTARSLLRGLGCLLAVALATRAEAAPSIHETVVESLDATRHSTSVTLDALDSSYRIDAPAGALENERLVLRNLDPRLRLIAKLNAEGRPDLASADGMLASVLNDGMSDEEKALALWKLIVDWRYDYISPEAGAEVDDPVKLINVYGYGLCGDAAAGFTALASAIGMPVRIWDLSGHIVAEVWYEFRWHMFDADHEVYYRASDGHILGVEELVADPSAILAAPYDPVGAEASTMADFYTSSADNYIFPPRLPSTHRIEPVLEPLDEVSFELAPGTVYSQSEESHALYPMYGPPPSFANGTLTRRIDVTQAGSDWLIFAQWPFLLVGGELRLELARDDADAEISIACGSLNFTVVPTTRSGQTLRADLRPFFAARRIGAYACALHVRSLTSLPLRESFSAGQVKWLFQFAPRALQQVASGGTTFHAELVPVAGSLPADWQGFELVHDWGEKHDFVAHGAQHFSQSASVAADLVEAAASFDAESIVLTILSAGTPTQGRLQVLLDTDLSPETGYRVNALGADFLVQNGRLLTYAGPSSATQNLWKWTDVGPVSTVSPRPDVFQVTIPRSSLGLIAGGRLNVLARYPYPWIDPLPRGDSRWEVSVPHVFEQPGSAATDLVRTEVSFDASDMVVTLKTASSALQNLHIYLDTDSSQATGYWQRSLGAEFLLENGFLFRHTGDNQDWSFDLVAPVPRTSPDANTFELRIPRAALGLVSGSTLTLVVEHWLHWASRLDSLPRNDDWHISVPNAVAQSGANAGDWIAGDATVQPGSIAFRLTTLGGPPELVHVFLDADADPSTGYAARGLGSDYLIENESLWRFTGQAAGDFRWTRVGLVQRRWPTPNTLEIVLPTAGLDLGGRHVGVLVENWRDWITPLDTLPRTQGAWQLAW